MKILKIVSIHVLIAVIFILPVVVSAQSPGTPSPNTFKGFSNPFDCGLANGNNNNCTIFDLIAVLLSKIVMPIASVGIVCYIIYAGFTFVTAQGKEKEITAAKERLLWSLIGAGIILGASAISHLVQNTIKDFTVK